MNDFSMCPTNEPEWYTLRHFARIINVDESTVRRWVKAGRVATVAHPVIPGRRVIPAHQVHRAQLTRSGIHIAFHGRQHPHQFYVYYLLATHGHKRSLIVDDLNHYGLSVPCDNDLTAMQEALFATAPASVRRNYNLGFIYDTLVDFESWMSGLGFGEFYEDPIGFLPPAILNSKRTRFLIEIIASAGLKLQAISNRLQEITDLDVDPRILRNYLLMFFYIRTLEEDDWLRYLGDIRRKNPREAQIRSDCCDSKIELYRFLGLTGGLDFAEEVEKCFWTATALYQETASSKDFKRQNASPAHARTALQLLDALMRLKDRSAEEERKAMAERHLASGPSTTWTERSEPDDDPIFMDMIENGDETSTIEAV